MLHRKPGKTKYYATTASADFVAEGGGNKVAEGLLLAVAGTVTLTNADGSSQTYDLPAGVWVWGAWKSMNGGTATKITALWFWD